MSMLLRRHHKQNDDVKEVEKAEETKPKTTRKRTTQKKSEK